MDFIDRIQQLANRIPQQMEHCLTEEATKTALLMPFINVFGLMQQGNGIVTQQISRI